MALPASVPGIILTLARYGNLVRTILTGGKTLLLWLVGGLIGLFILKIGLFFISVGLFFFSAWFLFTTDLGYRVIGFAMDFIIGALATVMTTFDSGLTGGDDAEIGRAYLTRQIDAFGPNSSAFLDLMDIARVPEHIVIWVSYVVAMVYLWAARRIHSWLRFL